MNDSGTSPGHGGDAGTDEPDVGQTSTEDLPTADDARDLGEERAANASGARDDDMAAGHIGEPGGPAWARSEGDD